MRDFYEIYFEIYGKKMKCIISATSEENAKYLVMSKIVFHKIKILKSKKTDNSIDFLRGMLGMD
jgi:hypothetical protein